MRILIINNLLSGRSDGTIFDFIRCCCQPDDELVIRNIGNSRPEQLVADARDFALVVVSGGDGTISQVAYALRYSGVPILPFPAGTGNLLVTNLDLPEEPHTLAALIRSQHYLDFDLGEISFTAEGQLQTAGFAVAAGAGFDAEIMRAAEGLKPAFGASAYSMAALANVNPTHSHFELDIDGRTASGDGIAVLVINFAKIGPGISITHNNNAQDGQLEVAILKPRNAVELLPALITAFLDRDGNFPGRADALDVYYGSEICIRSDPPLFIQYDGEIPDSQTPITARVLPAATRLVVAETPLVGGH
ncbi:MAG: NAD(+)/NADH kinase [Actinomycetia bacterium]|nr:NAD(+)/NADH kinase [Actinomycetes bacterium]